ncbi:MAG: oxidoreductase, partial [Bradymonadales bacterium]|nr:oxidoreductase [Bradymonadales bacterium]
FGGVEHSEVHLAKPDKMAGALELEQARVTWFLSVDANDLPAKARDQGKSAFRSLTMDGQEVEFSEGFTDLHTRVYEATLAGNGFGIEDARPSVTLVHQIRTGDVVPPTLPRHPLLG